MVLQYFLSKRAARGLENQATLFQDGAKREQRAVILSFRMYNKLNTGIF